MKKIEKKLSEAKARLLVEKPYFGTLAANLTLKENEDQQSFLSDGTLFEYNPDYLESLSIDELGFALSNGAMHAALAYENRKNERISWLWQLSTDYAINALLVQNGLELPERVNYERRFDGMYAEEIYAMLKDEIQNENFSDDESNETGFNENNERHHNEIQSPDQEEAKEKNRPQMEVENTLQEERFEQLQEEALQKADAHGELPEGIERFVELKHQSIIDWREKLHHALDRHYRNDYRMMPPSKKLLYSGIYLPSLYSERLNLVVAIDSSGSVDEVLLSSFIDELEALLLSFNDVSVELLICDDRIRSHQSIVGGERIEYQLQGGGGTSFQPVFEFIDSADFACNLLLYFTDLEGIFPYRAPDYETFWISSEDKEIPFGEIILLEKEN